MTFIGILPRASTCVLEILSKINLEVTHTFETIQLVTG